VLSQFHPFSRIECVELKPFAKKYKAEQSQTPLTSDATDAIEKSRVHVARATWHCVVAVNCQVEYDCTRLGARGCRAPWAVPVSPSVHRHSCALKTAAAVEDEEVLGIGIRKEWSSA
jgi:hypothetical protein